MMSMFPTKVLSLARAFYEPWFGELPRKVRDRTQRVLGEAVGRGNSMSGGIVVKLAEACGDLMGEAGDLVFGSLQRAIAAEELQNYDGLAADLKQEVQDYLSRVLVAAQPVFERHKNQIGIGREVTLMEQRDRQVARLFAEIDLYESKLRNTQKNMSAPPQVVITYNLHGDNSRVNINSKDYSLNLSNSSVVFDALKKTIQGEVADDALKRELLGKIEGMQKSAGTPKYLKLYSEFVALAANHISIIAPFIPALTKFLE